MSPDSLSRGTRTTDRRRLGEILVDGGAITADQLTRALAEQKVVGLPLGQTLLKLGFTTDETMRQALSSQLGVPYINLQHVIIDRSLATLLDRDYAREHALFPVARIGNSLTIAMDDPTARTVVEELAASTGYTITVVTSSAEEIHRALVRLYERQAGKGEAGKSETSDTSPRSTHAAPVGAGAYGYAALLDQEGADFASLLRAIEEGLPAAAVDALASRTGLPRERVLAFANIPADRPAGANADKLSRHESDRLVRAARVVAGAMGLFGGDRGVAVAWLSSGQPTLGGRTPLDLLGTELGAREVERALSELQKRA